MKVVNIGSCNIDYVYKVEHFTLSGETQSSIDYARYPGGKGLNQSIAISRSGTEVYHVGCIGNDGIFLKNILNESGVNTARLKVIDEVSGHAVIQVDSHGENCILLYHGANHKIEKSDIDLVLGELECGDIIVLQNEINGIDYIIERAYELGLCTVLNPSPFNEAVSKIDLRKISYLIVNEIEANGYVHKSNADELLDCMRDDYPDLKVIMTLGSKGSIYSDKNVRLSCPIFNVKVVDTTAAGDTFLGYFISGLVKNYPTEYNLRYASMAAALAVSKKGASVSIPTHSEVEAALNA